ncbi:pyrroloquinoline quinone biosynthesis peptide chaperone PqqD [Aromatoleum bremense]|uniref:Pyrroloquinoline quinone biosynthesis peptide chaperone PqqD n=1 Tax=Aromatoleum bremense TaxID=76115 RepID=A0ABX1NYE3_9RHOO|nr:pyrroloquinoline quinone biosynthesis peptide chaperone PqqD [Aromatoleum bremense]NMG16472.1 pyrroloquinoline quinone biosynthesis peptide chaperone PqqD [Aromatoleum bremense]QTQ31247.1 Coenzyme PQQ biosynthesis protein [Aromatoleum bremense]
METTALCADARLRLSPHFMFRWEASQDAYILLYPEGLIKLNPSAGEILKRCDGERSLAAIVADLQAAFPGHGEEIAASVRAFVELACDKGWLRS